MKGKFDAYVPLAKRVQNCIVDWSTACNFTVQSIVQSIFRFINRELFDLRKIYVVNLKTGRPKQMPHVGEFAP